MKLQKILLQLAVLLAPSVAFADDAKLDTVTSVNFAYNNKTITGRVPCHDPSIFIDTITSKTSPVYYIYGSHLGAASTKTADNYQAWTEFGSREWDSSANNSLFANLSGTRVNYSAAYNTHAVTKVVDVTGNEVPFGNFNAHEWQYTGYNVAGNQWAPDVIWNKTMKKWCMYMSVNGDKWASVIVCLTSNSPKGPWIYQGPVVFSGFQGRFDHVGYTKSKDYLHTDLQLAIGSVTALPSRYNTDSWGSFWPNCIDPCVFYDDNDDLWMSYGSWSGGIFVLKLNPENGLRDYTYKFPYQVNGTTTTPGSANANCTSDPYFGKKIAGGYYSSGEASYIEKIGKYYYLFMSYGGLEAAGGYQMRVFRADNPLGPYKDAQGINAIYDKYYMNYSSTSATNRGVLLMGGYKWDTMSDAELAQGHNSAFTDVAGRSFVVYHTRFANGGEGHQVRVHQLFTNQDGWIVAAPYEYSGEKVTQEQIETKALYTTEQIVGTYQLIRHTYCQDTKNKAYQKPVNITLNADGTVSGAYSGTWEVPEGTSFINIKLSTVTYKGVLTEQTVDYTNIKAMCIAAISSSSGSFTNTSTNTKGLEIWATKIPYKAAMKYTLDHMTIPVKNGQTIDSNISLPTTGLLGATVTWSSSNPDVITSKGEVVGDGTATLTLAISKDGYVYIQNYEVTVNNNIPVYYPEVGAKDYSTGYLGAYSQAYTLKKGETARFKFYNYTKGAQNWENWILGCYNNSARSTNYFLLRADNWELVSGGNNGCTSTFDWNTFRTDMQGAEVNMSVSYTSDGKVMMSSKITTITGKVHTYSYTYPSTLSLAQVVLYFSVEHAYLTRGDIDGIDEVVTDELLEQRIVSGIYDMNGKRYNEIPQRKGIYIVGGKKFVVR